MEWRAFFDQGGDVIGIIRVHRVSIGHVLYISKCGDGTILDPGVGGGASKSFP